MEYRTLGRTGLRVSEIGHGLWGMGDWAGSDDDQSLEALTKSCELGCTFFDSAWAYGKGRSDRLVGRLVERTNRAAITIATKTPPKNWKWPASSLDKLGDVYPTDYVLEMAERSCEAAAVDRFDLLQLHVWDDSWAFDAQLARIASALKTRKLCSFFGVSLNRDESSNGLAAIKTGLVDTVQVVYNIFDQTADDELFPLCAEMNVGVIARVPLDEGSLTGNLTLDTRFPADDWRSKYFNKENLRETVRRVGALKAVVPVGETMSSLALRFVLQNPIVSTVIVGMRSLSHIQANASISDRNRLAPSIVEHLKNHRWERGEKPASSQ